MGQVEFSFRVFNYAHNKFNAWNNMFTCRDLKKVVQEKSMKENGMFYAVIK